MLQRLNRRVALSRYNFALMRNNTSKPQFLALGIQGGKETLAIQRVLKKGVAGMERFCKTPTKKFVPPHNGVRLARFFFKKNGRAGSCFSSMGQIGISVTKLRCCKIFDCPVCQLIPIMRPHRFKEGSLKRCAKNSPAEQILRHQRNNRAMSPERIFSCPSFRIGTRLGITKRQQKFFKFLGCQWYLFAHLALHFTFQQN